MLGPVDGLLDELLGAWIYQWCWSLVTGAVPPEIIERVKSGERPSFRPSAAVGCHMEELGQLMQLCWAEDALERPDFNHIKVQLRKFNRYRPGPARGDPRGSPGGC